MWGGLFMLEFLRGYDADKKDYIVGFDIKSCLCRL